MSEICLSIIIPSFKRADLLPLGLASIRRQKVNFKYEIIVLNDGIEDRTEEICKEFNARYIFTGQRNANGVKWRCPGTVINLGVKEAKAEIILLTCPEVYLVQDCILQSLVHEVITGRNTIAITKGYDDVSGKFLEHLRREGTTERFNSPEVFVNLFTEYPFCLCISKEKFNSVGGYREEFTDGIGYDDMDFYFRVTRKGIVYSKLTDLEVIHLYHDRYTREGVDQVTYSQLLERNKQLYMTLNNTREFL